MSEKFGVLLLGVLLTLAMLVLVGVKAISVNLFTPFIPTLVAFLFYVVIALFTEGGSN